MTQPALARDLAILVYDGDGLRASIIEAGLREAGHANVTVVSEFTGLMRVVEAASPDVIIFDLQTPNRDQAEHLFAISKSARRPVAMFVDHADFDLMEAAIEAGVSAYVVDGLRQERVKPILDMAIARYRAFSRMRDELEDAKARLDDAKVIARAKALLIRRRGFDEAEAHRRLRRAAMDQSRRMGDVARDVLRSADLFFGDDA